MTNQKSPSTKYKEHRVRRWKVFGLGIIILAAVIIYALSSGPTRISRTVAISALLRETSGFSEQVVWQIRLPRVIAGLLAGVALGYAGAAMQSILRNPLGAPYTLGVSQAAAFGAAISIILMDQGSIFNIVPPAVQPYTAALTAFIASLLSTSLVLFLIRLKNASPETLILTGIALGALFNASLTTVQYFASDTEVAAIVYWTFGDLGRITWSAAGILATSLIISIIYFQRKAWHYTVLDAGDKTAASLGIPVERIRVTGMITASFTTAITISFLGILGFVGLVAPHIARKIVGTDERILLPASGVAGSILLITADTVARTMFSPVVLPVGVLTSFLGAPLFVYLVIARRGHW